MKRRGEGATIKRKREREVERERGKGGCHLSPHNSGQDHNDLLVKFYNGTIMAITQYDLKN
jgi:hypothetical protein